MKCSIVATSVATALLAACTMEPAYHRPTAPVPDSYPAQANATPSAATDATALPPLDWKDFFKDPVLQRLIDIALANNRDLRIAAANMAEARAGYGISRANLFPEIDLQGYAGRQRLPGHTQQPANGLLGPTQNNNARALSSGSNRGSHGMPRSSSGVGGLRRW